MKKQANLIGFIVVLLLLIFQLRIEFGILAGKAIPVFDAVLVFIDIFLGKIVLYVYLMVLFIFYGIGTFFTKMISNSKFLKSFYETDKIIQDILAIFLFITGVYKFFTMEMKALPIILIVLGSIIILFDINKLKEMYNKMI